MPHEIQVWAKFELKRLDDGEIVELHTDFPLCVIQGASIDESTLRTLSAEEHTIEGWVDPVLVELDDQIEKALVDWYGP